MRSMINYYIKNHKVSEIAHEEIMSMVHSDKRVAEFYYKKELEMTDRIMNLLIKINVNKDNLQEKVHIIVGMIDNLCHEVIYHKHNRMNYDIMTELIVKTISDLLN